MLNSLFQTWVKNVYSLGIQTGIKSGVLYPTLTHNLVISSSPVNNQGVIRRLFPTHPTLLSTLFFGYLPLLKRELSLVSTVPTIKKKKKS